MVHRSASDLWALFLLALSGGVGIGFTFGFLVSGRMRCYFRDWEGKARKEIAREDSATVQIRSLPKPGPGKT